MVCMFQGVVCRCAVEPRGDGTGGRHRALPPGSPSPTAPPWHTALDDAAAPAARGNRAPSTASARARAPLSARDVAPRSTRAAPRGRSRRLWRCSLAEGPMRGLPVGRVLLLLLARGRRAAPRCSRAAMRRLEQATAHHEEEVERAAHERRQRARRSPGVFPVALVSMLGAVLRARWAGTRSPTRGCTAARWRWRTTSRCSVWARGWEKRARARSIHRPPTPVALMPPVRARRSRRISPRPSPRSSRRCASRRTTAARARRRRRGHVDGHRRVRCAAWPSARG